jgi:hypothetical protein
MPNIIKLKNSGTANSAPTSLEVGELAINYNDGIVYYKDSSNAIVNFKTKSTQVFTILGSLSVGTGVSRFYPSSTIKITNVRASVNTAPTGASVIIDVLKNGTTIFTTQANRPAISASTNVSSLAVPNITSLTSSDYLTVNVSQVGSTIAGSDLTVLVEFMI